jgi:hypothetical protein
MTKKALIKELQLKLQGMSFRTIVGSTKGALLHMYKRLSSGLVLNLGVQDSSLHPDAFTGSFYLGPSFTWSYMPPSFPHKAYDRIGVYLSHDERVSLLSKEYCKPGVIDAWWSRNSESSVFEFCQCVQIAEPRFLAQQSLLTQVLESKDLIEHRERVLEVLGQVKRQASIQDISIDLLPKN